jgi:hypothetical protein
LEDLGVVSVAVATSEFATAAAAQADALGYDPAIVFVAHPIQDRTTAELHELADNAIADIIGKLTG